MKARAKIEQLENGQKKFKLLSPEWFNNIVIQKCRPGNYLVILEELKENRSLSQNALYWVYLSVISEETGNYPEDLHDFFKIRFLPKKIVKIKGRKHQYDLEKTKSTTELDKNEFSEYMKKIESMTEIPIPDSEKWLYGEKDQ